MCKCDGRHDYMEVGGRVMSGAITEEVLGVTVMYVVYAGALKDLPATKIACRLDLALILVIRVIQIQQLLRQF